MKLIKFKKIQMGKQCNESEDGFIRGLLNAGETYERIISLFREEFGRVIGHSVITRVRKLPKLSKRIKKPRGGHKKTSNQQDQLIIDAIRENNRLSWKAIYCLSINEFFYVLIRSLRGPIRLEFRVIILFKNL